LALLQELGLADRAHLDVAQLGPSQRRLVEIARAMMGQPALLVLDEPTAGMDRLQRDHLAALLRAWRQRGLALFLVEHDIGFVTAICERLCCMEAGRIVAEGAPVALRADPTLRRFFGSVA
jgi:ABC-type branched-subunit amino acid transport system ATPase component